MAKEGLSRDDALRVFRDAIIRRWERLPRAQDPSRGHLSKTKELNLQKELKLSSDGQCRNGDKKSRKHTKDKRLLLGKKQKQN